MSLSFCKPMPPGAPAQRSPVPRDGYVLFCFVFLTFLKKQTEKHNIKCLGFFITFSFESYTPFLSWKSRVRLFLIFWGEAPYPGPQEGCCLKLEQWKGKGAWGYWTCWYISASIFGAFTKSLIYWVLSQYQARSLVLGPCPWESLLSFKESLVLTAPFARNARDGEHGNQCAECWGFCKTDNSVSSTNCHENKIGLKWLERHTRNYNLWTLFGSWVQ